MSRNIATFIYIVFAVFLAWMAISWVEVILKNIDGVTISCWNFFKLFPKLF